MKASLRWLSRLLDTPLDALEVRDRLAMLGAPADAMERTHAELAPVVVGLVVECDRHPNADRLSLTRVDDGSGQLLSVVCGAPNVQAGRKYPFARVGVVLPGGLKLERRKIRGETSEGMLCSARELGLGQDGDGILELATEASPGTPLLDVLPLADMRYDLDVGANRPDLLSHEGLARDLGAVLRLPVKLPAFPGAPAAPRVVRADGHSGQVAGARVTIEDTTGCPRYTAAVIRGVRIGPSPAWLRETLEAVGSRSISNVVDATNYLMFENGQPLHAFDLARVRGGHIIVRQARAGERLRTLDGVERELQPGFCLICDEGGPTGLAGVMGGGDSEISAATTDILLECAWFDPRSTRRMRRALGMSTDASYRFERGVDHEATAARLARAAELIVAVAGGRIEGLLDVYPAPMAPRTIFLREERIAKVLGAEVPLAEVERVLTALGCVVGPRAGRLAVQVPAWRPDLEREIDLIEEIARVVGYDRFPDTIQPFRPGTVPDAAVERQADRLRDLLTGLGLHEAVTLPLGPREADDQVAVRNPLSQDEAHLRRDLLSGLVRRVEYNWRHMVREVRLFEVGHVFTKATGDDREVTAGDREATEAMADAAVRALVHEEARIAGVVTGARRPPHWSDPQPPDADLFDAKALLEALLPVARPGATIEAAGDALQVRHGGAVVGHARRLDADSPPWAAPLVGFELALGEAGETAHAVAPLPLWPAVERDVALVLPAGLAADEVQVSLRQGAGRLLESCSVFDEYRGAPLGQGERSVAWRLVFRAPDRTLRDEEIDKSVAKALKLVEDRHGVRRRTA